jgi:hypothetical protein
MPGDRQEANILNACLVALSEAGCTVWRNNTGAIPDRTGRLVRFGLCVGRGTIRRRCSIHRTCLAGKIVLGFGTILERENRWLSSI